MSKHDESNPETKLIRDHYLLPNLNQQEGIKQIEEIYSRTGNKTYYHKQFMFRPVLNV